MPSSNSSTDTVHVSFQRTASGVQVHVKAPVFEDFFKSLASHGRTSPSILEDRAFGSARFYQVREEQRESLYLPGCFYEICGNHARLIDAQGNINLAIFSVVGAGDENGVTFTSRTVLSKTQMTQLAEGINRAGRTFYAEMMEPTSHEIIFTVERISS